MCKRIKRYIAIFVYAIAVCLSLTGCYLMPAFYQGISDDSFQYYGEHPDGYTVLKHSVLGVFSSDGVGIIRLEQDDYGRTLFACEAYSTITDKADDQLLVLLITQKSDEESVYYLEGGCYIICSVSNEHTCNPDTLEDTINEFFTQEQITALKERNHWGMPLSGTMAIRQIQRKFGHAYQNVPYRDLLPQHSEYYDYCIYLDSDQAGQALYFSREYGDNATNYFQGFLVLTDANGTASAVTEVTDLLNFQEQLDEFKAQNGWEPIVTTIPES